MIRKLLFVLCLLVPLALWGYGKVTQSPLYKANEVIRQIPLDDFKRFPVVPLPHALPTVIPVIPKVTKAVKPHKPVVKAKQLPLPAPMPITPEPVVVYPEYPQLHCIWPLSLIPTCVPQG